jgi:NADH-quinone oxidoreductase subunit J
VTEGALLAGTSGWLFVIFSVLALASAVAVVVSRSPVHSALFLLVSFLLVACIFFLQQAEFVGAVQILVYAGGIMVLFPVFLLPFLYILWTEKFPDVPQNPDAFRMIGTRAAGNTEAVSWVLFRDYLVPFEVASVFLLVAMVGAVVLGKRSLEKMD